MFAVDNQKLHTEYKKKEGVLQCSGAFTHSLTQSLALAHANVTMFLSRHHPAAQ